ncbi:hypothetical protein HY995_03680 [Candidatus Micrarchaeota archaeon]|nr:hypothetical protein [Candidatus Micrarchaeota archaeon]MBI5177160.1 hypothetical protein [Candidatus Micrarchaeota archaeon]
MSSHKIILFLLLSFVALFLLDQGFVFFAFIVETVAVLSLFVRDEQEVKVQKAMHAIRLRHAETKRHEQETRRREEHAHRSPEANGAGKALISFASALGSMAYSAARWLVKGDRKS